MAGWVKLWRDILDHPVFEDPVTLKVFVWCLARAKIEATKYRGESLQPGQFSTGRNAAGAELSLHPSSVYRAFQRLQELNCIAVEANNVRTVITVCNWSTYQDQQGGERTSSEQDANKLRTSIEQAANTIEESKNLRIQEGEEEIPPTPQRGKGSPRVAKPKFDPRSVEVPESLRSPAFESAWHAWIDFRASSRKPLKTEAACRMQLSDLARAGPQRAVETIRHSIKNEYQGLYEPNGRTNGKSAPPPGAGQRYEPSAIADELDLVGTL